MLAVLPFSNLAGETGQDYLSDGFTEEMITQLGRLDPAQLGVIARTSVMRYKDSREPVAQIGTELGVQYVLEGSVLRDVGTVRITAQLIQVHDQTHVWAQEYDRELKNLLLVQEEIAREIGDEIRLKFDHSAAADPNTGRSLSPQEVEGYDLYLKGKYFFGKRTVVDLQKAIDCFQQATARNPNYARAYAAMADSYALLGGYSGVPQAGFLAKARVAALRALELDDNLPDAHTALALIVQNYDWDWHTAEREFRRAIQLNPNYATAHHWYAEHLMWRGRFEQALQESEQARRLDPLSLIVAADQGAIFYYSRQYDQAIQQFRSVLDRDPEFTRAHLIVSAYVAKGMFPQAMSSIAQPIQGPWAYATLAFASGRAGHLSEARNAIEQLQRLARTQQFDPAIFAWAYLGIGDNGKALAWLQKAHDEHSNTMTALKVEPAFDPLRSDSRFQELLTRVGLAR